MIAMAIIMEDVYVDNCECMFFAQHWGAGTQNIFTIIGLIFYMGFPSLNVFVQMTKKDMEFKICILETIAIEDITFILLVDLFN